MVIIITQLNRIMATAGFDRKSWQVLLSGWYRLPDEEDENPAVADFLGRGRGLVVYNLYRHQLAPTVSSGLPPAHNDRGSVQFTWSAPVVNNFRLSLQLSEGYGETLMDYNHRQRTIGVAAALVDW